MSGTDFASADVEQRRPIRPKLTMAVTSAIIGSALKVYVVDFPRTGKIRSELAGIV